MIWFNNDDSELIIIIIPVAEEEAYNTRVICPMTFKSDDNCPVVYTRTSGRLEPIRNDKRKIVNSRG